MPSSLAKPAVQRALLYLLTAVVAACSILYELVLAQTLAALLGNTVLRYCITIGCYLGALGLGAMLCSRGEHSPARRLFRVEIALSLVGGAAVPAFFVLDGLQRHLYVADGVLEGSLWVSGGFLAVTHAIIVAIGVLSGFEIPLLLRLGESLEPGSTNRVLGVDYLGSLVGSVLFPLVLLPGLGLFATAFAVALLNAVAGGALLLWKLPGSRRQGLGIVAAVGVVLGIGLLRSERIEQHFLQTFYYLEDVDDPVSLVAPTHAHPEVRRIRSPYQTIDLVRDPDPDQWLVDLLVPTPVDHPRDLWLYLDGEFQFFSGVEALYHEWFVHVPIQLAGKVPRRALVLGGGDGMAVRELLAYPEVEEVVQVELDPEMIELSRNDPDLSRLNAPAHRDPRHRLVQADAFSWLRAGGEPFDAAFVDMPYPKDHNLSLVYSREFYAMLRHRLVPDGFVVLDAPDGWCLDPEGSWPVYYNTLREAGFARVEQLASEIDLLSPRVLRLLARMERIAVPLRDGGTEILLGRDAKDYLRGRLEEAVSDLPVNEFMVAFSRPGPLHTSWQEHGIELRALRPDLLEAAVESECPHPNDPSRANSIVRPTLPPMEVLGVRTL